MPVGQDRFRRDLGRIAPDPRLRLPRANIVVRSASLNRSDSDIELEFFEDTLRLYPCHEDALRALGYLYTDRGNYEKGLEMDLRLVRLRTTDITAWYNLACSYALLNETDKSINALAQAIDLGYDDLEAMELDDDLEAVRTDLRYVDLCDRLRCRRR